MTDPPGVEDAQDVAEALDDDTVRARPDYTGDEPLDYPPDRPLGSLSRAITPTDELVGEGAAERAGREVPDPALDRPEGPEGPEGLVGPEEADVEPDLEDAALGSLVDPDADIGGEPSDLDDEAEEVATAAETVGDESAEEAAVHLTRDPPWHRSDGYVQEP
ncbi:MAG: hypothetical protein GEV08_24580 [Acidimicrobiia bacterium]|nr:hypothetical protein [Acidimicrobiia bacterium]